MPVFNAAKREIDIKIVYYGPALCGKTTNVNAIHKKLPPTQRGEIMALATKDDRTLFFDFLSIELGNVKGFKTRFHVYTVPGQVYYALTRRAVLTGVDGVIFVADSQQDKINENIESLNDLEENLKYYRKELKSIPFIIQYNKRDLENILPVSEMNPVLNKTGVPFFESSAKSGEGVMETLTECCKIILKKLNRPQRSEHGEKGLKPEEKPGQQKTEELIKKPEGVPIIEDTDSKQPNVSYDLESENLKIIKTESIAVVNDAIIEEKDDIVVETDIKISAEDEGVSIIEDTDMEKPHVPYDLESNQEESLVIDDISSIEDSDYRDRDDTSVQAKVKTMTENEKLSTEECFDYSQVLSVDENLSDEDDSGVDIKITEPIPVDVSSLDSQDGIKFNLVEESEIVEEGDLISDFKILACGMPRKISDTSINIPLICSIQGAGGEFETNISFTVDIGSFRKKK